MGSVGRAKSSVRDLVSKLADYDQRYADDVIKASEKFHREFPDFPEIKGIWVKDIDGVAAINGLGILSLNPKYLSDYEAEKRKLEEQDYWLAGNPNYADAVITHELGHSFDVAFSSFVSSRAPELSTQEVVKDDFSAQFYSDVLGKPVNIGDTVSTPTADSSAVMFKLDGQSYTYKDLISTVNGRLSDIIVPKAIENIQNNWRVLGFSHRPTEKELVSYLSGYSNWSRTNQPKNYHAEVFAESYANHSSLKSNASVLSQEVMRLANQAYSQVSSQPKNSIDEYYRKIASAMSKKMGLTT